MYFFNLLFFLNDLTLKENDRFYRPKEINYLIKPHIVQMWKTVKLTYATITKKWCDAISEGGQGQTRTMMVRSQKRNSLTFCIQKNQNTWETSLLMYVSMYHIHACLYTFSLHQSTLKFFLVCLPYFFPSCAVTSSGILKRNKTKEFPVKQCWYFCFLMQCTLVESKLSLLPSFLNVLPIHLLNCILLLTLDHFSPLHCHMYLVIHYNS